MSVSIIIPTFKPKEYIFDCIDSLFDQESRVEFEVLIIVNGDKEPFFSQIQKYVSSHEKFRVIYTEQKGVSNARNVGINESIGEYLIFLDDDDWLSSNYIDDLFAKSSLDNIVVSNVVAIDESGNTVPDYIGESFLNLKDEHYNFFKFRKFLSSSCCKLIPRNIIKDIRFNPNFKLGEDSLFMFELSKHISSVELSSEDCIYYRRVRSQSASQKISKQDIYHRIALMGKFSTIYLKNISKYNFLIYVSRMVASIAHILKMVTKK